MKATYRRRGYCTGGRGSERGSIGSPFDSLGSYEADLVSRFMPHAAVALRNARRTESLERTILKAERKHAMADLARGISHDINNALGGVLPLVQQLRDEAAVGKLDADVAAQDLEQIERSMLVCRRIFGGMLKGVAREAVQCESS